MNNQCRQCGYTWESRTENEPTSCPRCGTRTWKDIQYTRGSRINQLSRSKREMMIKALRSINVPQSTAADRYINPYRFKVQEAIQVEHITEGEVSIFDCLFDEIPEIYSIELVADAAEKFLSSASFSEVVKVHNLLKVIVTFISKYDKDRGESLTTLLDKYSIGA